jgi:hypothetical protein
MLHHTMHAAPRIVIADRSLLAANLYRILLAPFEATLLIRRRADEAIAALLHRETTHLAIFNASVCGDKIEAIIAQLAQEAPLAKVRKIFLVGQREMAAEERFASIPNTSLLHRPFHPEAFTALVRELLEGRAP